MRNGEGATSGLPPAPPRSRGPVRWFSLGASTGVVCTLVVVFIIMLVNQ